MERLTAPDLEPVLLIRSLPLPPTRPIRPRGTLARWVFAAAVALTGLAAVPAAEARVILDARDPEKLNDASNDAARKDVRYIDVAGLPFDKALQVRTYGAHDQPYAIQFWTAMVKEPVRKGEVIEVRYWIRGSSDRGVPAIPAYLQAPEGTWRMVLSIGSSATDEWTEQVFRKAATEDYKPYEMNATFHLGDRPQLIEIGGLTVSVLDANSGGSRDTPAPAAPRRDPAPPPSDDPEPE